MLTAPKCSKQQLYSILLTNGQADPALRVQR